MNKKIIIPIFLLALLSFTIFVSAYGYNPNNKEITIRINKGWNLIPTFGLKIEKSNSNIQSNDFKYGFIYHLEKKEYSLILRDGELLEKNEFPEESWARGDRQINQFLKSSMWVYSEKEGDYNLNWVEDLNQLGFSELSTYELDSGWNFIFVTPEMSGLNLDDIKGSCDWQKVYSYGKEGGQLMWMDLLITMGLKEKFTDNSVGYGLLVKVPSDCVLGSSIVSPPPIPN